MNGEHWNGCFTIDPQDQALALSYFWLVNWKHLDRLRPFPPNWEWDVRVAHRVALAGITGPRNAWGQTLDDEVARDREEEHMQTNREGRLD
jgi:hypothetical protein